MSKANMRPMVQKKSDGDLIRDLSKRVNMSDARINELITRMNSMERKVEGLLALKKGE